MYLIIFERIKTNAGNKMFTFVNSFAKVRTSKGKDVIQARTKYKVENFHKYIVKKMEDEEMMLRYTKKCLDKGILLY